MLHFIQSTRHPNCCGGSLFKPEMNEFDDIKPVILHLDPTKEELARTILRERRLGSKDRRKIPTYIADDRRSGIADRRKGA